MILGIMYHACISSDQYQLAKHKFRHILQVASMCTSSIIIDDNDWTCAHWRHLENTLELVLPSAHLSPKPKWQIDRFSRFCTARSRKSIYCKWALLPPKLPLPMGIWTPSNTWFLWAIRANNTNGILIELSCFCTDNCSAESPYTLPRDAPSFLKIAPSHGDLDPHLIHGSLGPP